MGLPSAKSPSEDAGLVAFLNSGKWEVIPSSEGPPSYRMKTRAFDSDLAVEVQSNLAARSGVSVFFNEAESGMKVKDGKRVHTARYWVVVSEDDYRESIEPLLQAENRAVPKPTEGPEQHIRADGEGRRP